MYRCQHQSCLSIRMSVPGGNGKRLQFLSKYYHSDKEREREREREREEKCEWWNRRGFLTGLNPTGGISMSVFSVHLYPIFSFYFVRRTSSGTIAAPLTNQIEYASDISSITINSQNSTRTRVDTMFVCVCDGQYKKKSESKWKGQTEVWQIIKPNCPLFVQLDWTVNLHCLSSGQLQTRITYWRIGKDWQREGTNTTTKKDGQIDKGTYTFMINEIAIPFDSTRSLINNKKIKF